MWNPQFLSTASSGMRWSSWMSSKLRRKMSSKASFSQWQPMLAWEDLIIKRSFSTLCQTSICIMKEKYIAPTKQRSLSKLSKCSEMKTNSL
jgi:hypothetical protein